MMIEHIIMATLILKYIMYEDMLHNKTKNMAEVNTTNADNQLLYD